MLYENNPVNLPGNLFYHKSTGFEPILVGFYSGFANYDCEEQKFNRYHYFRYN